MAPLPIAPVVSALLTPIGQVGLWIALAGAAALGVAIAFNAAGAAGGAGAVWLAGGILSLALWYSGDWMAPLAAGIALPVAAGLGAAWRPSTRRALWARGRSALSRPTPLLALRARSSAPAPVTPTMTGSLPRPALAP
ncbi:hypothetical protein [Microbacterium aurantiacum]|uniref:hypothetical protein n=1 Tax=Microbacterium aurantiacum TaxID=162393 RepID=UPI000C80F048|nr:hypothetical protein [Microbacterium aurantiacum]